MMPKLLALLVLIQTVLIGSAEVKPLNQHPQVARLWMGGKDAEISPIQFEKIEAKITGSYDFHILEDSQVVEGDVFITVQADKLELERESYQLELLKFQEAEILAREEEADKLELIQKQYAELQEKLVQLEYVLSEEKIQANVKERLKSSLISLTKKIRNVDERLDPERRAAALKLKLDDRELSIRRQKLTLENLERNSLLKVPFNGNIEYIDTIKNEIAKSENLQPSIWLNSGDSIGRFIDEKSYEVKIIGSNTVLAGIPSDELEILIRSESKGVSVYTKLNSITKIQRSGKMLSQYNFTINANQARELELDGVQTQKVQIFRKLPTLCYLISKRDIAFKNPEVLQNSGWRGLVKSLWPECKIVAVSPQGIAVEFKDEN